MPTSGFSMSIAEAVSLYSLGVYLPRRPMGERWTEVIECQNDRMSLLHQSILLQG